MNLRTTEYAPPGCVSFMTIHQAKGMEFPSSLSIAQGCAWRSYQRDHEYYCKRYSSVRHLNRLTRLSSLTSGGATTPHFRAQNLLVLTCNEHRGKGKIHNVRKYFQDSITDPLHTMIHASSKNSLSRKLKKVTSRKLIPLLPHCCLSGLSHGISFSGNRLPCGAHRRMLWYAGSPDH